MAGNLRAEVTCLEGAGTSQKRKSKGRHNQPASFEKATKTRRSGFLQDHSDILSAASQAMVDHP